MGRWPTSGAPAMSSSSSPTLRSTTARWRASPRGSSRSTRRTGLADRSRCTEGADVMRSADHDAYDLLGIGSGIAGLVAALAAAPRARVCVVTKAALDDGCSRYAQGGIAAAVAPGDSPDLHFSDTVAAGRGLCDEAAV